MTTKTINQTTQELQSFFKTQEVIYQAKVGYFVHMTVNGVNMKETSAFVASLGLVVSMVRATPQKLNRLSLFLEKV